MSNDIYLVTGGSSGIGYGAILELAKSFPEATIITAARSRQKNLDAVESLRSETKHTNIHAMDLDLTSLAKVKSFYVEFQEKYGSLVLKGVLLNAGVVLTEYNTSADGYEQTFAINHLGHYLLLRLLLPHIDKDDGVVRHLAIVSSFTINPKNFSTMPFPKLEKLQDCELKTKPPGFNVELAYTNSKLLNALTGLYVEKHKASKNLIVSIYDPGYVPTDILKKHGAVKNFFITKIGPVAMKLVWKKVSDLHRSGKYLAYLGSKVQESGKFYSVDWEEERAEKASNQLLAESIWKDSEALISPFL
ncbi:hypothetical protein HDV06_001837 [Boothiomyces sp. JEL0866]|nr:hypothetical protein HDV06_001837 [Boothiomyces sp. JEL0866]